jgi:2-polyprenyl-3-methyl-5-hydroxy-6-metoxy-1,4-benzoquinol methylase
MRAVSETSDDTGQTAARAYFLGHSEAEIERLALQSAFYRDTTQSALRRAGLAVGMRVLDIGCGGGDVSLIAAELVGPAGSVLGIDRSAEAVAAASRRVANAGLQHVRFAVSELDAFAADLPFDALIGRFVLMYMADAAATLRVLVRHLRPGGIVVFEEMEMRSARSYPDAPLFQRCIDWYATAIEGAGFESGMGGKLLATFQAAGLPAPQAMVAGRLEAGPESPGYALMAANVRTMLPMLLRLNAASEAEVGLETLAERLRQEAVEGGRCLMFPLLISACSRLPAPSESR